MAEATQFVAFPCSKKADCFCKAWDGKGSPRQNLMTESCDRSPESCEFLVEAKRREGCDWIWKTISGSPQAKTAIATPEEPKPPIVPAPKQKPKPPDKNCTDCGKSATHKIEGYKPTYLCEAHARKAEEDGFVVIPLEEEND